MPARRPLANPTSSLTTACQIAILLYTAVNHLLDDAPHHLQHSNALRSKPNADNDTYHHGSAVKLPHEDKHASFRSNATPGDSRLRTPSCDAPPRASRDRNDLCPCPRGAPCCTGWAGMAWAMPPSHSIPGRDDATRRLQGDAWMRMRGATTAGDGGRKAGKRKRVRFSSDVRCIGIGGDGW